MDLASAIYIHFPFCRKRCDYCDFCSNEGREEQIARYVECVVREIQTKTELVQETVQTIFIGGGTPSLMEPEAMNQLMHTLRKTFTLVEDCEITTEVNPESAGAAWLQEAWESGVNRISIGAQSFVPQVLNNLGRLHSVEDIGLTVALARDAGFGNLSLDLIFGSPEESLEDWAKSLDQALMHAPEHISTYSLTIEPGTPLAAKIEGGKIPEPDPDLAAEMYDLAISRLTEVGYDHYEISNFSLPGQHCRHNWNYWDNGEYLGLGCGAFSYVKGERYRNTDQLDDYLKDDFERYEVEEYSAEKGAMEDLMLGLRRVYTGVDLNRLALRRGDEAKAKVLERIDQFMKLELLELEHGVLRLTDRGLLFADEVLQTLI